MVRCVFGSILHGGPIELSLVQPVLLEWCNKGCGMCYPACGMVHIKEPLLLIRKSSPCGGNGFPLSLSEWSFTICPTPSLNKTFPSFLPYCMKTQERDHLSHYSRPKVYRILTSHNEEIFYSIRFVFCFCFLIQFQTQSLICG